MGLFVSCTGNGTQSNKGESGAKAEFILDKSLPDVPQTIISYKIVQPIVTLESVSTLGARFGFTGNVGPIDPSMIGMSNPEKQEIFQVLTTSGTIEYTCLNDLDPLSPTLPSNEEAVKIATEFLQLKGLWHSDLVADEAVVGGTADGVTTHLLVRFARYIDEYPITGPGNKFAVRIGDKGKVVGFLLRYDELEKDKEVQIIAPSAAFEKLNAGDGVFTLPIDCSTVRITDVSIGYYLESISDKQENLTPYYIFKGECRDAKDGFIEEFTGWVDAVSK
jgi:hypothetical protein